MRHRKSGRRLGRNAPHRRAMMRNLVTSLFKHGRIRTTEARAKELRRVAEKVITLGKRGLAASNPEMDEKSLAAKRVHQLRQILRIVTEKDVARKVVGEYAEHFSERPGGYTRILKLGHRHGDKAPISLIELVGFEGEE